MDKRETFVEAWAQARAHVERQLARPDFDHIVRSRGEPQIAMVAVVFVCSGSEGGSVVIATPDPGPGIVADALRRAASGVHEGRRVDDV